LLVELKSVEDTSWLQLFIKNSRQTRFTVPSAPKCFQMGCRDPFFRRYGVNLPSSLRTVLSSALGYAPRIPVSVCGTDPHGCPYGGFLGGWASCSGIQGPRDSGYSCEWRICLPLKFPDLIAISNRLPALPTSSPLRCEPSIQSAGILTCCPSATPFGLTLGSD